MRVTGRITNRSVAARDDGASGGADVVLARVDFCGGTGVAGRDEVPFDELASGRDSVIAAVLVDASRSGWAA
jgi:hypothetical protein